MKKVFLFMSDGFEDVEAVTSIDYLRRAGFELITVSLSEKYVTSAHGIKMECDAVLAEVENRAEEAFMAILPGGMPNSKTLGESTGVKNFVLKVLEQGGIAAAICAAPAAAFGKWGLIDGKNYTCYPGMGADLKTKPLQNKRVVKDGNIITACAAGAAEEFALTLIEAGMGKEQAEKIKQEVAAR